MYLTQEEYVEYTGEYPGEFDEETGNDFRRCEYRARKVVDMYTFGRIGKMAEVPEAVKRLMVELINLEMFADAARRGEQVKSFSNDGYSESYETFSLTTIEQIQRDTVTCYLLNEEDDNGTPLLYTGVDA